MSGEDLYDDLKAAASEHGVVPAFKFTKGDPPGKVRTAFIRLMPDSQRPGFVRLVIHDEPEPPDDQYPRGSRAAPLAHRLPRPVSGADPNPLAELIERTRNGAAMARQSADLNRQTAEAFAARRSVFGTLSSALLREFAEALEEQAASCEALAKAVRARIAAQESN